MLIIIELLMPEIVEINTQQLQMKYFYPFAKLFCSRRNLLHFLCLLIVLSCLILMYLAVWLHFSLFVCFFGSLIHKARSKFQTESYGLGHFGRIRFLFRKLFKFLGFRMCFKKSKKYDYDWWKLDDRTKLDWCNHKCLHRVTFHFYTSARKKITVMQHL